MTADRSALLRFFRERFGREPAVLCEAPGRVNLIGEHTDYNDGFVLPVAIDRTAAVAATATRGPVVRALSLDFAEADQFSLADIAPLPGGGWRNYVRGVAWALVEAGIHVPGADMAIAGDVPVGAGLSSSAALEMAVAGALCAVAGPDGQAVAVAPLDLALLCQRAENEFAGVQCGVMDQLAAAFGRRGHALLMDCRSLAVEPVPLGFEEAGVVLAVVDSGVRRSLEATPYNQRREQCAEAARLLAVPALRDVDEGLLDALPEHLYRRARHVVSENARVLAAVAAQRAGDVEGLGRLLYESHRSLRDDFEVSCPELDLLVELACRTEGVLGARLTGAGFGGCTVNLVRREALAAFRRDVVDEYRSRTGRAAELHVCAASDGLSVAHV